MKYLVTIDRIEVKTKTFEIESDEEIIALDDELALDLAIEKARDFDFSTVKDSVVEYEVTDLEDFEQEIIKIERVDRLYDCNCDA